MIKNNENNKIKKVFFSFSFSLFTIYPYIHKHPFYFIFLVYRIFLLLLLNLFFFSFVPCLLRFITSILVRNKRVSGHGYTYMLSFVQFVFEQCLLCNIQKKMNSHFHICLLLSCKRKCLIFAWLCFFFFFSFCTSLSF